MKTVFLFIPSFVYSSDFLRTDYIKYLSSKYKVIVFIPPQALCKDNKSYYISSNITYVEWSVQFPKFWNFFGKFLRYSLIRTFDFEPVVKRNRMKGLKDWRRGLLRFISFAFPKEFWTNKLFTKLELFFIPQSKLFNEKVKEFNPALVLTATPGFNHIDAEAIIFAKKAKITTAAVNFSWDNLHNGGMHFRHPDYLIVWNEIIKKTAVHEYRYSKDRVFVSGPMRFDSYFIGKPEISRNDFLISKGLDPNEKTILISTVTKGNYPDEHILLRDLIEARDSGKFNGCPNVFVRMHPKEEFGKFKEYMGNKIRNVHVELPGKILSKELGTSIEIHEDDLKNLKSTLSYSDVNVNYASTITLESFVFDKPVVNINYPEKYSLAYSFRHYKPIVDAGAVELVTSFPELIERVTMYLNNPKYKHREREKVFNDFIHFRDGKSYERNVNYLSRII